MLEFVPGPAEPAPPTLTRSPEPFDVVEIPVFCYHNALPSLEEDLVFLAANDYRTLLASEVVDILRGGEPPTPRCVALTFDDGLASVLTVGLPLLERYRAKATVFAITGLVPEGAAAPDADTAGRNTPTGREALPGREPLLGWDDLATLVASGLVEIGSHGHRHNPVHVAATDGPPLSISSYRRLYDVPVPYGPECDEAAIRAADGRPQRPARPLFGTRELLVDGAVVDARGPIAADLANSRRLLSERLGVERFHLCLPYGAGSEELPQLAEEAGFESIFWSRRADRAVNRPGDDPLRIGRQKHDYVRRLPGRGRRSWVDLVAHKLVRRLSSDPWI